MSNNSKGKYHSTNESYTLNVRIKYTLNEIIDHAYADESERQRIKYKRFTVHVLQKENRASSGSYDPRTQKIEIYNLRLGESHIAKCCLHELAHHIDCCKNGKTGHQKPFYNEYEKLIFASLDCGILTKADFQDAWSSDRNKVAKIIEKYTGRKGNISGKKILRVYNAYPQKDLLKARGYRYNGIEQTWEKEYNAADDETSYLESIQIFEKGVNPDGAWYTLSKPSMHVDAILIVSAEGNTYQARDELKKLGFYYKNGWKKKLRQSEKNDFLKKVQECDHLDDVRIMYRKERLY